MNKKLFFNIVFMTAGTFVVVVMTVIMFGNFVKDGRVFQPSVAAVSNPNVSKSPSKVKQDTTEEEQDEDFKTLKYDRPPVPVEKKDPKTETKKDKEPEKKDKIKIEVINYSGVKRVAEDIRSTLQASGYDVSAGNGESKTPVKTTIIEYNDKGAGSAIQGILNAGKIKKSKDPTSRFDVTIIIGDDYRP